MTAMSHWMTAMSHFLAGISHWMPALSLWTTTTLHRITEMRSERQDALETNDWRVSCHGPCKRRSTGIFYPIGAETTYIRIWLSLTHINQEMQNSAIHFYFVFHWDFYHVFQLVLSSFLTNEWPYIQNQALRSKCFTSFKPFCLHFLTNSIFQCIQNEVLNLSKHMSKDKCPVARWHPAYLDPDVRFGMIKMGGGLC